MLRGVLGGFLTGTILSGLALGTASYLTPLPGQAPPEATSLEVPAGSEFNGSREDTQATLPGADETPEADAVPRVEAPEPDTLSSLEGADTAPASQPQTGQAEDTLTAPDESGANGSVEVDTDEPVLPSPQSLAPEAPEGEQDLSVSTEPAEPLAEEPEPQPEPVIEESSISVEPVQPAMPEIEEGTSAFPSEPVTEEPVQPAEPAAEPALEEAEPSGTIGNLAEEVTTDRLPSVSADQGAAQDVLPPLDRFATPFENPEGKPLMAIVLIDDGGGPISFEALADFPYPISYAVDANWSGAAAAAARYRAAGLEVLAMADLPEGASATDAEVAMQAYLSTVPEAVAVMEGTGTGLQSSRAATEQLIPILQDSGHGLVLFSEGLDTAQKLIAREGVPVVSVFRDFDGKDQNATVIRRFLDQAAFKAGQGETGVIMVGRLRAETVSALLLWGLQDRAASVALAPVSAVLRAENPR